MPLRHLTEEIKDHLRYLQWRLAKNRFGELVLVGPLFQNFNICSALSASGHRLPHVWRLAR